MTLSSKHCYMGTNPVRKGIWCLQHKSLQFSNLIATILYKRNVSFNDTTYTAETKCLYIRWAGVRQCSVKNNNIKE
jgi:hypothetical protein